MMTTQFFTKPMSADYARAIVVQSNTRASLTSCTKSVAKDNACARFSFSSLFKRHSRKQTCLAVTDDSSDDDDDGHQRLTAISEADVGADLTAQQPEVAADTSSYAARAARKEAHQRQLVASQSLVAMLQVGCRR